MIPDADSLEEAEWIVQLEPMAGRWKLEWLDDQGNVLREHDSDSPPSPG